jgi:hypothetical protein
MDKTKYNEAKNPETSPERLEALLTAGYARAVAQNPSAPTSILERLSRSVDPEVKGLVAENPNTSLPTLFHLGVSYPSRVVRNPLLPLILLENPGIFSGIPQESLRFMLTKKDIPEAFLEWAYQNIKHLRIREAVARNPKTPASLLEELLFDASETVREGAAKNPSTPQETLQLLRRAGMNHDLTVQELPDLSLPSEVLKGFMKRGLWVRRLIASHPNTPASVLEALLREKEGSWMTATLVAKNPSTPPDILRRLAAERSYQKNSVARNPKLPEDLAASFFAEVNNRELKEALASNPGISLERLLALAQDKNCLVRAAAARHPMLPDEDRRALIADKSLAVRRSVVYSPNITAEELTTLSQDPKPAVRLSVACCTRAPREVMEALTQDKIKQIRESATRTRWRLKPQAPQS